MPGDEGTSRFFLREKRSFYKEIPRASRKKRTRIATFENRTRGGSEFSANLLADRDATRSGNLRCEKRKDRSARKCLTFQELAARLTLPDNCR